MLLGAKFLTSYFTTMKSVTDEQMAEALRYLMKVNFVIGYGYDFVSPQVG